MDMAEEPRLVSIMQACKLAGVSRRTIYNWIADGKIEYRRTAGGSIRIFEHTLWRDDVTPAEKESASV